MAKLTLEKISVAAYNDKVTASTIDSKTIYWREDGTIYVGGSLYGGKFSFISTEPAYPEQNTLYINTTTLTGKVWNGVSWDTVTKGYTTNIADDSTDELMPTAKAVATYVQNKIADVAASGTGVTSLSYISNGQLAMTKDGTNSTIDLTGMTYSPTYDSVTKKLTIPVVGSSALEVSLAQDTVVKNGKYNEATNEIWLTIADDGSYDDDTKLIKIPVSGLIDVYTGKATNTATTTVSATNEISVDVKISAESGNSLITKDDGLYVSVPSDTTKVNKVDVGHVDEIITATADGYIKLSGTKVGGSTLSSTPDVNTVATEAAVKTYADAVATNALNNAKAYTDSIATTTLQSAKDYADGLIEWKNF
jgi:hypothetical protein